MYTRNLGNVHRFLTKIWENDFKQPHRILRHIHFDKIKRFYEISLCITCMDRFQDIKETLPKNLIDNAEYKHLEFVLLDYNSKSLGLVRWIRANFLNEIKSKRLAFYRTVEPKFYNMPHSRNIALRLARGDIVNNVDADNFTQKGFARHINKLANFAGSERTVFFKRGNLNGRLGFFKKEFLALGGYDELLKGYGHDDRDLLLRALESGFYGARFDATFYSCTKNVVNKQKNFDSMNKNTRISYRKNIIASYTNLIIGRLVANEGRPWGITKIQKMMSNGEMRKFNYE